MAEHLAKFAYMVARDASTTTVPTAPTSTSLAPSASTSAATQSGQTGPQSSPLLFFVALGFGVVFTNLWIIVGVKYCFRYNARNRAMRQDENGEPIDLGAMPRQHRRRREKKLMTMDEVNERFPLTKYKAWVQARAEKGLSTAGGVANPSSRPASVKGEGVIKPFKDISSEETEEGTQAATSSEEANKEIQVEDSKAKIDTVEDDSTKHEHDHHDHAHAHQHDTKTLNSLAPEQTRTSAENEEDDEDDQIQVAVPTGLLENPGDSCAICLDTLDDEDDVRGLTCGHAFHASCIDPWLTSRRACCPLCKADYYTPKPRPDGDAAADASTAGRGPRSRVEGLTPPPFAFMGNRRQPFGPRMVLPGRFMSIQYAEGRDRYGSPIPHRVTRSGTRSSRFGTVQTPIMPTDASTDGPTQSRSRWARFRPSFNFPLPTTPSVNGWRNRHHANDISSPEIGTADRHPTPGQLEAGTA
ncbi:MAG: hypothetical protein MMC33_005726 [Icmadophila ericetorum]|nr:hypothetical protein [Icmadophila ericetorum]